MLIREQGNAVKLIRVVRSQGALRARQHVVGSVRLEDGPSKALLVSLANDERISLERWLSARHQQQHRQTLDDALPRLAELAAAIDAAAELLSPTDARAIWHELDRVSRAFKRVRYPKTSRQSTDKARVAPPAQGDLLG